MSIELVLLILIMTLAMGVVLNRLDVRGRFQAQSGSRWRPPPKRATSPKYVNSLR